MGNLSQYELRLASLPEGKFEQDMECDSTLFRAMDNEEVRDAVVNVHLTVMRRGDVYDLSLYCRGTLTVACDRCLEDMQVPVDTTYVMTVRYGAAYDDSTDDLLVLPAHHTTLNLAPTIYTTLMLCIPLRKTHAPGECNPAMLDRLREHGADDESTEDNEQ